MIRRFNALPTTPVLLLAILAVLALMYLKAPAAVGLPLPGDRTTRHITQALEVTPPLATAYDICQDPSSRFAHFKQDDHFEADLAQNAGQLKEVRYHLFFRADPRLSVIIEEARAGQRAETRTDPNTAQFQACVATKRVEEVTPRQ